MLATRLDADRCYVASALLTNALEACLLTVGLERTENVVARLVAEHGLVLKVSEETPARVAADPPLRAVPRFPIGGIRWADLEEDSEDEADCGEGV